MSANPRRGSAVLALLLVVTVGASTPVLAQAPMKASTLGWMAGNWKGSGKSLSEEHWMGPAGGMLLGMSRTVRDGKTKFFEFVRIEERGDSLVYVAQPQGAAPTDFRCVRLAADEVVFENLQHDFPKRIIYRKTGADSLLARVEGDGSESEKAIDYRYVRSR